MTKSWVTFDNKDNRIYDKTMSLMTIKNMFYKFGVCGYFGMTKYYSIAAIIYIYNRLS